MAVATTIVPEMGDPSKMELTSRWVFRSGSESYGSEPVSSSSTMSDSSHSLSISDSDDFNRTIIANPKESLFQPGELQKGYVEVPMHSDVLFVNLPQRVVDALLHSRRIVVEGDGKIRSLPFDSDEFSNLEPHTDEGINPLQRRVLHALGKENITKGSESSEKMEVEVESEEKENCADRDSAISDSCVGSMTSSSSSAAPSCSEASSVESVESKEILHKDLLRAIGLSSGQIDRLYAAPVWTPMPRKKSEEDKEDGPIEEDQSPDDPNERSWEIAAILRPQIIKKVPGVKEKEYLVVWKDWPWYDQWSLKPESFDGDGKRMAAADTRERLVSQMAAYMQQKDKQGFDEMFPAFQHRHDFTSGYRVHLRVIEQSINDELEDLGMAPIYIENWTNDERVFINVKYLTRCALSVLNYREVKAAGRSVRLQYPDDGAGCDCKDGICTPSCPCIRLMGRDQIRMRSTGKVDVEKLAEATTVECGTTCSCTSDCPSRFAERGRKIPLVVMYTTTKGWSVFAPQIIPAGTFLGVYTGEIIPLCSAISQGISTSYQFTNIHQIPGTKQYVVDASRMGNETRYFNHACGDAANLKAVSLLSRGNLLTNNMLFFTKRMISKGEELTFSYRGKDMEEQKSGIRCLCLHEPPHHLAQLFLSLTSGTCAPISTKPPTTVVISLAVSSVHVGTMNKVLPIPRIRYNRRQSTKTGREIVRPQSGRRALSIPSVRVSPRPLLSPMSHTIEISIAISDLVGVEHLARVNCVLWQNDTESEKNWRHLGTTNAAVVINRSVDFEDKISFKYVFEKAQLIKIDICRLHDGETASGSDDVVGSCIFKVDELIGSFGLQLRRSLLKSTSIAQSLSSSRSSQQIIGGVIISAQMPEKEQPIIVQLHGRSLQRKDLIWDETAVFFRVFRLEEGKDEDELVLLYESEAIKNHSHPQWGEFRLGTQDAADNRNRLLEVWVMYRDVDGSEGYIGKFLTTYAKMKYGPGPDNVYTVINELKQQQKKGARKPQSLLKSGFLQNYENSGRMELVKFTDVSFFSFLDYIVSGTQLHYEVAVDFSCDDTVTEVDQRRFDADLQLAIRAIGGILRDYTPNRLFAAFGLGAKTPPTFHEAHEFHLNFNIDPICRGLDGVIEAYRKAQSVVSPMKTAKFAPVVNSAIRTSQRSGFRGLHYHVLAIFTRGTPTDMKELSAAIAAASDAPLSIVIVGIGHGEFSQLLKLAAKRKEGTRSCLQFITISDILEAGDSPAENRSRIAQKALRAIPEQMADFMHAANIAAKPPIQVCRSPLFHSSSLIPDRPTQFVFDGALPQCLTPQMPRSDRRGSDSQYLDVEIGARNTLTVRVPERCHSVLQTTREQYQRRLKERGLGKMRFPRMDLSTLESSGGSTQDSSL